MLLPVETASPSRPPRVYRVRLGTAVVSAWSAVLLVGLSYASVYDHDAGTRFLHWGPSDAQFGPLRINTWPRWGAVLAYSITSQVVSSIASATLSPYVSNVIRDYKTPRAKKGTWCQAQGIVFAYTLVGWVTGVLDVFVWVTLQVQFILPALLADLALTAAYTHSYLVHCDEASPLS